jgi:hypothetical protein
MKYIIPTNSLELGAGISSLKTTKMSQLTQKHLNSLLKIIDYDLIDEKKPSHLPLALDSSSLGFTFALSSPNPKLSLAPLFFLLIYFLSLPLSQKMFL